MREIRQMNIAAFNARTHHVMGCNSHFTTSHCTLPEGHPTSGYVTEEFTNHDGRDVNDPFKRRWVTQLRSTHR